VQKYIEHFIYTEKIASSSIPIAYYESDPIDSWKNIQIVDKTYVIPDNDFEFNSDDVSWTEVVASSCSSKYKNIALTTETIVGPSGKIKPLFFKHKLPDNTVEAHIEVSTGGNRTDVETGYKIDVDNDVIFTNFQNYFNPDTGAFRLHFVVSSDMDGNATHALLNPIPAAKEATWEDIVLTGPDAGTLTTEYPTYSREKNASGYTFYFNMPGTWYVKPLRTSMINTLRPPARDPDTAWNIGFTDGDITAIVNGDLHRYYVPEYDLQPFAPSKPYVYAPYRRMLYVNRNTLVSTRPYTAIDRLAGRHITIYVYDENDILKTAYTTDGTLEGKRAFKIEELPSSEESVIANAENVFYESDKIISVDNQNGFVLLNIELEPTDTYYASYFYESHDLEYTGLDFNPIQNKDVLDHMYVFYMHPDANSNDRAIHYIKVDRAGIIVETSQNLGRNHPNLKALNSDGTANPFSIIGKKYNSAVDTGTFLYDYCVPYYNDYHYYILAEIVVLDVAEEEDSLIIDVRRPGAVISEDYFEDAIRANPKVLQSHLGYGEKGQEVPENSVIVINAPVTLLEDYGGVLTRGKAEKMLKAYTNQAVHSVIDWVYEKPQLTGQSDAENEVTLSMTWEGPNLTYNLYRRENQLDEWAFIHKIENPPEGTVEYIDSELESNKIYYYSLRVTKDDVLLPHGNMLGIMVR
jgi:hypothetical protein